MREQTIVWRDDFDSIEFNFPLEEGYKDEDWAHSLSAGVIISRKNCGKSIGNFFKERETGEIFFESTSGWRTPTSMIKEFAFLEQSV